MCFVSWPSRAPKPSKGRQSHEGSAFPRIGVAQSGTFISFDEKHEGARDAEIRGIRPMTKSIGKHPFIFFVLVFIYAVPIEAISQWLGNPNMLPAASRLSLRLSTLIVTCPMLSAVTLTLWEAGWQGIPPLFATIFDFRKIDRKVWYLPILLIPLLAQVGSFILIQTSNHPILDVQVSLIRIPVFFAVLFVFAAAEEIGWSAYAITPLRNRFGALNAGIILGVASTLWHLAPRLMLGQPGGMVLFSTINTIELKIIMAWIFFNTGRSVFGMIVFHALDNVWYSSFPNYGSHYSSTNTVIFISVFVAIIVVCWDAKTLTKFRFAARHPEPASA
jgi:membrane protease YdiL (CAAX protease family)